MEKNVNNTNEPQHNAKRPVAGSGIDWDYEQILKEKQDCYGKTEASYHFAAEKYATLKMIEENKSILEMAKRHLDSRAILVIQSRIDELSKLVA